MGELTEWKPLCGAGAHRRSLASPRFPVKHRSFGGFHAALFTESRIRCRWYSRELGNPGTLPRIPVEICGVDALHAPFWKDAHAALSSATWQEIRVGMTSGG